MPMMHTITPLPFDGDYSSTEEWYDALDRWYETHIKEVAQANDDYKRAWRWRFWEKAPQIEILTPEEIISRELRRKRPGH